MCFNNGLGGNNCCLWIILILILVCCCGCGGTGTVGGINNGCHCTCHDNCGC